MATLDDIAQELGVSKATVSKALNGAKDVSKAMQPLFTTDPNGERAGIGFAVMQTFMDSLKVKSSAGKGTRVVMTKKIIPRE